MKLIRQLWIIVFCVLLSNSAVAFDSVTDCKKTLIYKITTLAELQTIFNNYTDTTKYSKKLDDGTYTLCFDKDNSYYSGGTDKTFTLTASPTAPLLIYGLNLTTTLTTGALLQLSGSSITLDHVTLTGPTPAQGQLPTGTAIQVSATGSTIGPSNNFTDFATGIDVKQNATANITQNKFTNVEAPIYWESPFWAADPILVDWFGKHISEADSNAVDRIAGKLDLTECKGSVDMYLSVNMELVNALPFQYHTTCPAAELKDKPLKLTFADKSEKEIAIGSCYFDCDNLQNVSKYYNVSFLYSSGTGMTAEFMPLPAANIGDLAAVIFLPIYVPTDSNADGTTIVVTTDDKINTGGDQSGTGNTQTGGNNDLLVDGANTDSKAQTTDTVGQGSGACSVNLSASAPTAGGLIVQIMFLFASLPIIFSKRKR